MFYTIDLWGLIYIKIDVIQQGKPKDSTESLFLHKKHNIGKKMSIFPMSDYFHVEKGLNNTIFNKLWVF